MMRRPSLALALGGGGEAAPTKLDLFTGGTFTRASEGSYLTGAPTNGSSAFLAWAATNARRIENRGDSLGNTLLLEGSRTNFLYHSRDPSGATWASGSLVTTTYNQASPDGANTATRSQVSAGGYGRYRTGVTGTSSPTSSSLWSRRGGSNTAFQINYANGSTYVGSLTALTAEYMRIDGYAASASLVLMPADGRAGMIAASNLDVISDLHQIEIGAFPSSAIRTTTASVARSADVLTYEVGAYPASFLTSGFALTFTPDFSSAEMVSGSSTHDLVTVAPFTNGAVALVGSFNGVGVYQPGTGWLQRVASWSRYQTLTITVRPGVSVTLSGFTTGNGTVALGGTSWVSGTLYIGSRSAGTSSCAFGRFGRYIEAA